MERQPTRSKRVREDRRFDKTQLRASGHGRTVHRDYASHVLRWNFVAEELLRQYYQREQETGEISGFPPDNFVPPYLSNIFFKFGWVAREVKQGMKILDVGCGQDQPLLYILGARIQTVPELYVGVDLNRIMKKSNVRWSKIYDEFDFTSRSEELLKVHGQFDMAVNFEVIEHMAPEDGAKLLRRLWDCLKPGGVLHLSTPVFDGLAAANHIHEYTIPELQAAIEFAGFKVERRLGTFASKYTIENAMLQAKRPDHMKVYQELSQWFGGDVLATFMAPLYPDSSRNNLWVCRKPS